jgi:D-serine deaminase-like pyridoxal phosphate-dependent protein
MLLDRLIGAHKSELDTPALCIDLNQMESNMRSMASFLKERGKHWRPHVKCHKTPVIAHQQLQLGALGVTSAKVSEAAVFLENGVSDVLIANMLAGSQKLERVAGLCWQGDPIVAVDHFAQAEALSEVCLKRGVLCRVVIEVNIGLHRVGVRPGWDARDLARGISQLKGVRLVGVMGYEGHLLTLESPEEKRRKIFSALDLLAELRDMMQGDGLACEIVSAGGTGSYQIAADHPAVTEIQAGGGIFADPFYLERCGVTDLAPSLSVLTTVCSRPTLERAILDTGRKSVHPDIHPPRLARTVSGRPLPDAKITMLSAEHLTVELGPESQFLCIGDKVELIPGYSDHTTVLHDYFVGVRNEYVEAVWPISARGCLQ